MIARPYNTSPTLSFRSPRSRQPGGEFRVALRVTSPRMRTARPGPGNGWRNTISFGKSELQTHLPHFVFEELPERLNQFKIHFLRQPADVVMTLDHEQPDCQRSRRSQSRPDKMFLERENGNRWPSLGLDLPLAVPLSLLSNTRMNSPPMIFRFVSGSVTPSSNSQKAFARHRRISAGYGNSRRKFAARFRLRVSASRPLLTKMQVSWSPIAL